MGLLACFAFAKAQDIDSLYQVFERGRGEAAYHAAVAIDESLRHEPNFDADTDKDEIQQKLLRTMTLANAYQRFGQLDKALECYNRCSDLMDEIGGEMAAVNKRYVMNNIAEIHLSMDEYGRAEELYRKCIEMLGEVGDADTASNLDMATYLQNLVEVRLAEAGVADSLARALKLAEAVGFAQRSLDLSQRYADTPHKIVNRMTALSKATFQMGRTDEGLALMEQALGIAEENGDVFMEAVSHVQRGQFERRLHHNAEAEMDFQKAIAIAEENHFAEVLQEALESIVPVVRPRNPE